MKQKPTVKSLLVVASLISLSAFVFVNLHSSFAVTKPIFKATFAQSQVEESEDNETVIVVPDITVLGRLFEIAQKVIDRKN